MSNSKNVTYYLGAGASANALPVVGKEFNKRFRCFCEMVAEACSNKSLISVYIFLQQVMSEFEYFYSPDTYARKLFFTKKLDYEAYKQLLSAYLIFEQFGFLPVDNSPTGLSTELIQKVIKCFPNNRPTLDPRYDVVFAALLDEKTKKLPSNLRVISWNYDVQIEKSYSNFSQADAIHAFSALDVFPNPSGFRHRVTYTNAQMVKVNGIAGLQYVSTDHSINFPKTLEKYDFMNMMTDLLNKLHLSITHHKEANKFECMLHFAWENDTEVTLSRKRATKLIETTDILVVIGYSFPLYNRRIDKEILTYLSPEAYVYIQVAHDKYDGVENRFKQCLSAKSPFISPVEDLDQFYVPDELL